MSRSNKKSHSSSTPPFALALVATFASAAALTVLYNNAQNPQLAPNEIEQRATAALANVGYDWAHVTIEDGTATIVGEAPGESERIMAFQVVRRALRPMMGKSARLEGVTSQLQLSSSAAHAMAQAASGQSASGSNSYRSADANLPYPPPLSVADGTHGDGALITTTANEGHIASDTAATLAASDANEKAHADGLVTSTGADNAAVAGSDSEHESAYETAGAQSGTQADTQSNAAANTAVNAQANIDSSQNASPQGAAPETTPAVVAPASAETSPTRTVTFEREDAGSVATETPMPSQAETQVASVNPAHVAALTGQSKQDTIISNSAPQAAPAAAEAANHTAAEAANHTAASPAMIETAAVNTTVNATAQAVDAPAVNTTAEAVVNVLPNVPSPSVETALITQESEPAPEVATQGVATRASAAAAATEQAVEVANTTTPDSKPGIDATADCKAEFTDALSRSTIEFASNSAAIEKQSRPLLDTLAEIAKRCRRFRLVVEGHTDLSGRSAHNQILSQKRADAVRWALVDRGVDMDHITSQGFGASRPLEQGTSEAANARNRRIEFSVLEPQSRTQKVSGTP